MMPGTPILIEMSETRIVPGFYVEPDDSMSDRHMVRFIDPKDGRLGVFSVHETWIWEPENYARWLLTQ